MKARNCQHYSFTATEKNQFILLSEIICSSYVTIERLEACSNVFQSVLSTHDHTFTRKKRNISKSIEHKTQPNNIFRKKRNVK